MTTTLEIPDELIKEVIVIIGKGIFNLHPYTDKEEEAALYLLNWVTEQTNKISKEEIERYGE